jgi:myo-inositol-1(or 4)-monophosphatase
VTEAGGLIGNFTGESDFLEQRECLAAAPRIYGQLVPLLAKYSKFAGVDDKMRASDRVRQVAASANPEADASVDLYARTTTSGLEAETADENTAAPVAPAPRKLSRIKRDAPGSAARAADGDPTAR